MSAQILPFPAPSERDRDAVVTTHPFGGCTGIEMTMQARTAHSIS